MGVAATPARIAEFREALAAGVLTADGAMGTMLATFLGGPRVYAHRSMDELNLGLPALVRNVHQEYLRAGAQIIGTNTFGANRERLGRFGLGEKTRAINRAGVRIAREATRSLAGDGDTPAFVAGIVGPLGARSMGVHLNAPRACFREQMDALVESGVDLLVLETFQDLKELHEAILAAREAAGPDMAVVAHLSVEEDGSLACGAPVREFTRRLEEWPVDVIGLNCSYGPSLMLETVEKMAAWSTKPLSVMPNAGLPWFGCAPEYLARMVPDFLRAGARIVGGCCGTTPEHIRQIRVALGEAEPVRRVCAVIEEVVEEQRELATIPAATRSELGAKLASGQFVAMVEMRPPRGPDASMEVAAAIEYKQAGIDFVAMADGPACQLIQRASGVECVLHLRGRKLYDPRGVQRELLGANVLGIRNVCCEPSPGSAGVAFNLNRGLDFGGRPLGSQTGFLVGVMLNPASLQTSSGELDESLGGADYAITEPVFELEIFEDFLERLAPYRLPVIASLRPLRSLRDAEFLMQERRTPIPAAYLERMRGSQNEEAEGLAIAHETIARLRGMAAGVYLLGNSPAMSLRRALH